MTRKQAKRRKQQKARKVTLPAFPWRKLSALLLALATIALSYQFSAGLLDQPITAITIEGPFQRVSALQIEEAISDELASGFLSANLSAIQEMIVALPWIDKANVVRRWPGSLEISVTEQIPAACWGESGLLNTRGELFVTAARHVPAELPRLSGPEGHYSIVASRYLDLREQLLPTGLDVRRVHVDARGAWQMTPTFAWAGVMSANEFSCFSTWPPTSSQGVRQKLNSSICVIATVSRLAGRMVRGRLSMILQPKKREWLPGLSNEQEERQESYRRTRHWHLESRRYCRRGR
jgi:cell division protein FtsQ